MQVLISIDSYEEALSVLETGLDIMDVKNPQEGSLGAQVPRVTRQVIEIAQTRAIKTSATLGDLPDKPGTASLAALGAATMGVHYIKAGLHDSNTYEQAFDMMDHIGQTVRMANPEALVIACGYADWRRFDGLSTTHLVRAAIDATCDGVMVDTALKDGTNLFDHVSAEQIKQVVEAGHAGGLIVGLAGSIIPEHADVLFEMNPDVVGVRGAVCRNGQDRRSQISPEKVQQFCELFHGCAAKASDHRLRSPGGSAETQ